MPFDFSRFPEVLRVIDTSIYTRKSLADTQAAFREHCTVSLSPTIEPNQVTVTIKAHTNDPTAIREIVLSFWNYLLDCSCQQRFG